MVKIACFDDAFLEVFKLQGSPVEGQSLQQKEKGEKGQAKKIQKSKSLKT